MLPKEEEVGCVVSKMGWENCWGKARCFVSFRFRFALKRSGWFKIVVVVVVVVVVDVVVEGCVEEVAKLRRGVVVSKFVKKEEEEEVVQKNVPQKTRRKN